MFIDKQKVDDILAVVPSNARACYTGQSILAYCPDPTFSWEEMSTWEDQTDVDIFCYSNTGHAAITQAYIDAGWKPDNDIEEFKAERIRFYDPNRKFNLQTVSLKKENYPLVNISWRKGVEDSLDCIKQFDMDYLMVGMDLKTKIFADLRGKNHRVAHVNPHHQRFDPMDVEPSYWYRQFDRCPKGWNRGIDTRPVARQYLFWIEMTLKTGDRALSSKTREYADRYMKEAIGPIIGQGFSEDQAKAMFHLFKGEQNTWEAQRIKHEAMRQKITSWLASVDD